MPNRRVVLLGAGGGTRELISLIRHAQRCHGVYVEWDLYGILDDNVDLVGTDVAGVPVLGPLASAEDLPESWFLNGIASAREPTVRCQVAERLAMPPERWATFVHPGATILDPSEIGHGAIVYPNAVVSANGVFGPHAVAYFGAVVHHDSRVGEGSCLCAAALVAGFAQVGRGCYLGIGSVVRDHVRIGDGALIGAGAVVIRDVLPESTVAGVPARRLDTREL